MLADWTAECGPDDPTLIVPWSDPESGARFINLRTDPFERAPITSNTYYDWLLDRAFLLVPAQKCVADFLATLKDFPPRQRAASFTIDETSKAMLKPTDD